MADSYELKALLSAVDKITPVVKDVARNARRNLQGVAKSAAQLGSKIGLPIAAVSGALVAGGVAAMKGLVTQFATAGAALDDTSKRTGIAATQLQALAYVGEQADVAIESLQGAVGKLNKNIAAAAAGKNKEFAALFARLRIPLRQANGELVSAVDVLPQLADAFQANTNAAVRARIGNTALGKSYQDLMPLLVDGSAGIRASLERWKRVGFPLTQDDIDLAAKMDDQFVDLRYSMSGIGLVIGKTLAPVLSPMIESFIKWAAANRDLIAADVKRFIEGVARAIERMGGWDGLYSRIKGVVQAAREFVAALGGVKSLLIALAAVLTAGPVVAFAQFLSAVGKVAWMVAGPLLGALFRLVGFLFANPITGIFVALVTAAILVYQNWDRIKGWFRSFFEWIGEKWAAFTGWIGKALDMAKRFLGLGGGDLLATGSEAGALGGGRAPRPLATSRQAMAGSVTVDFRNAPQGMQVVKTSALPGLELDVDVGYRSPFNTGGPF